MLLHRRLLAVILMLVVTGLAAPRTSTAGPISTPTFSVASGDTTQDSTVLWAHSRNTGDLVFEYAADADFKTIIGTAKTSVTDPALPVKVELKGLTPGARYYYRATDATRTTAKGTFRTPAALGTHTGLRFGVTGDWRQELAPYPSIKNVPERDLAFMVLHGDTIYADYASPDVPTRQAKTLAEYRAKHNEALSTRYDMNMWAAARASTSVYATIDDHEVTNDFAGGAPPASNRRFDKTGRFINETNLYKAGLQAFQDYMPIRQETYDKTGDPRTAGKPKLYRYRAFGSDAAIFVLDARSFRDAEVPGIPFDQVTDKARIDAFLASTYQPGRTLLGKAQLDNLKADLLTAQKAGVTWKFILLPEPIQNLGIVAASDRYEGYAAERADLLAFIKTNALTNVVFITADFHGTIVNNLAYQTAPDQPLIPVDAWEIITGPVAFAKPFGPTVIDLASAAGYLKPEQKTLYNVAPIGIKDTIIKQLVDFQMNALGYDPVGLQDSSIEATLIKGDYVATHVFGWTEFEIDAQTQRLLVTTYGIPWYTQQQLDASPQAITGQTPQIVSQFSVKAKG